MGLVTFRDGFQVQEPVQTNSPRDTIFRKELYLLTLPYQASMTVDSEIDSAKVRFSQEMRVLGEK